MKLLDFGFFFGARLKDWREATWCDWVVTGPPETAGTGRFWTLAFQAYRPTRFEGIGWRIQWELDPVIDPLRQLRDVL